jgi:hypothetical protein
MRKDQERPIVPLSCSIFLVLAGEGESRKGLQKSRCFIRQRRQQLV